METKNIIKKTLPLLCIVLFGVLIKSCNEDLYLPEDIRNTIGEPVIENFEPKTGSIGTNVVISGKNLASTTSVTIGGGATEILYRYTNYSMVIRLVGTERTGPIRITNNRGYVISTEEFRVIDFVPVINSLKDGGADLTQLVDERRITINGEVLNAVRRITFGTGNTIGRLIDRNDSVIIVEVPYFEETNATINFEYMADGRLQVLPKGPFTVNNTIIPPTITNTDAIPEVTGPNRVITLRGTHLDRVSRVFLSGYADSTWTIIAQSRTELRVLVPMFPAGLTTGNLTIVHNINREEMMVKENLRIINEDALNFFMYRGVRLEVQRPTTEENFANFFNADNGEIFNPCDHLSLAVDVGEVTTFYFDQITGGIRLVNPMHTANSFQGFRCVTTPGVEGEPLPAGMQGSKATRFRVLWETPADLALAQRVKDQAVDSLYLSMFAGTSVASVIGNLGSSSPQWTAPTNAALGNDRWDVGSVIVFREYLNASPPGTNASGSGVGGRFGFIEIVSIEIDGNTVSGSFSRTDWDSLTANQQRRTTVTVNVYFQKVREL